MNSEEFLNEILAPVHEFCRFLDVNPPAYCYVPLRTDEERIRVMKSRLFNELRAADLFGTWLKTTPEFGCQSDDGGIRPRRNGARAAVDEAHRRFGRGPVRLQTIAGADRHVQCDGRPQ